MPYVSVDGCRVAYDRDGHGRPLLLVHGAAQDSTVWRRMVETLAGRFDVVCPDLPGHGKSALRPGGVLDSVDAFARALREFVRELGLVRPVVVGHSLGGAVSLRFACLFPDEVSGIVNIAGAAESASAAVAYPGDLLELVEANPTDWMETNFFGLFGRHVPTATRWALSFDARRVAPEVVLGDLRAYTSCDFAGELAELDVPVLSIAGEDDWSCAPERVRGTHERIPGGVRYVELPETGHLPHLEDPEGTAALVADFVEGTA